MKKSRWFKWQRGQALMEYWPTIPASIVIMLAAAGLVQFINGAILETVEYLNPTGFECTDEEEVDEGPTTAELDCHTIELVGNTYDEGSDQTTVVYRVTSGCDPDISHWVLALPESVASNIVDSSERYEYVTDPATGVTGIKFDTEYGDSKKEKTYSGYMLVSSSASKSAFEARNVLITLGGYYDWSITTVTIKAGTEVYYSEITAPMQIHEGTDEECETE
jgi:hypothetical protein